MSIVIGKLISTFITSNLTLIRGKATRNQAHRIAYQKRTSRKGPSKPMTVPLLSESLLQLATKPLPTSDLFLSTLHDPNLVDESDIDHWDRPPPYPTSTSHDSELYTKNLIDVMHGRRLRIHCKEERRRMQESRTEPVRALRSSLSALFEAQMMLWEQALEQVGGGIYPNERETSGAMARHYLQWSARRAMALHEELEAVAVGMDAYTKLFNSRYQSNSSM